MQASSSKSLIEKLSENGTNAATFKKTLRTTDLEIGKEYKIHEVKEVKTKYGVKALADLGDCMYFFPDRLLKNLTKKDMDEMFGQHDRFYLMYLGRAEGSLEVPLFNFYQKE